MKRSLPVIIFLFIFLGIAVPARASLPVEEGLLNDRGAAYEINTDQEGWLWVTDMDAGEIWHINPDDGEYNIYPVGGSPMDARRNDSLFWWADDADNILGRAEVISGVYTLWQIPAAESFFGTAIDYAGNLWAAEWPINWPESGTHHLVRLTVNSAGTSGISCFFTLPENGGTSYLTYQDPYLWIGDEVNRRIVRVNVHDTVTPNTFAYDSWSLPGSSTPLGMAVDEEGDLWYADWGSFSMAELDPDNNILLRYPIPAGIVTNPQMIAIQEKRIWYSSYTVNTVGMLDTVVADYIQNYLTLSSGTLNPICTPVTPSHSGSFTKSPGTINWTAANYESLYDDYGWQIFEVPADVVGQKTIPPLPWGIAYKNEKVWVVDKGRQKIIQIDAPQSSPLSLDKTASPPTFELVGDAIGYSYELTNNGNGTLTGPFTVTDNKTVVTCPATTSLAPGASISCTGGYTITQVDLDAGSLTNTATGHGFDGSTPVDSNTDSETVTAVQYKMLTLEKSAEPLSYDSLGDVISYSFELTNSGNVTLAGPFTVTDNKTADETCPATASLAPGASITCGASYTVTQADLDTGSVTNTASGHAIFGSSPVNSGSDAVTVNGVQSPALAIVKEANPTMYDSVGDEIGYSYVLSNTGNVTLAGPFKVTDNMVSVTCPDITSLTPGQNITCTATYTITPADITAGSVTNTASGHGFFGVSAINTTSVEVTVTRIRVDYKVFLPLILR